MFLTHYRRFHSIHHHQNLEPPRLWRSRGFLLHGLILSHESRITVLSPLLQRFIVSSIKSVNPCFRMFLAAFMSRSCVFWHCGHFHSVSYFRSLLQCPQLLHILLDGYHLLICLSVFPYISALYLIISTNFFHAIFCNFGLQRGF